MPLTENETIALNALKQQEIKQLTVCQEITGNTTLSADEYQKASSDFKQLIEIPWEKGEPIYIMPEFDQHEQLRSELKTLIINIERGTSYHQFVPKDYGLAWPLLLRLYYGLSSGFKISIEQMKSMLNVCYWNETGLISENFPIFQSNGKQLSTAGEQLIQYGIMPFSEETHKKNAFICAMQNSAIPLGEKSVQRIILNQDYINFGRLLIQTPEMDYVAHTLNLRNDPRTDLIKMQKSGTELFANLMLLSEWTFKMSYINNKIMLFVPSQTMLKVYLETINPGVKLVYQPKLGIISPQMTEYYSNRNSRIGNLIAPGVTNPQKVHGKISKPAFVAGHDIYHWYLLGTLSLEITQQMSRAKYVLRQVFGRPNEFTAEIMRSIECERSANLSEDKRFFHLLKYIFAEDVNMDNSRVRLSSTILLVDMILHPDYWPSYLRDKEKIMALLLHAKIKPELNDVETTIVKYNHIAKDNYCFITMLVLCHFYLNDKELCQGFISNYPCIDRTDILWEKNEVKHLALIFKQKAAVYTIEHINSLTPEQRITLLAPTKYFISHPITTEAIHIINNNHGKIIFNKETLQIEAFFMPCNALKKPIREVLGIDRVKANKLGIEQQQYLQNNISNITLEPVSNEPGSFYCTFPKEKRPFIKEILENWEEVKQKEQAAKKIQRFYHGYRLRVILFQNQSRPEPLEHPLEQPPKKTTTSC